MGPLVENLQGLGYVDGENLITAPVRNHTVAHDVATHLIS